MSLSTKTLPPTTDEDLTIATPLAVSEARALEKSRLINPTPLPRQPILAPLEPKKRRMGRRAMATVAVWLLLGAGLAGRMAGVVDTSAVDSVAIADLEPMEDWLERNGLGDAFGDNLGTPRQLAATDDAPASSEAGQLNSQVVSVATDDPEQGLSRSELVEVEDTAGDVDDSDETAELVDGVGDEDGARGAFALAWSLWLGAEHSVIGEVTRERLDGDSDPVVIPYRAARKGDASMEQLGSSAVVVSSQGRQTCDRDGQGVMLCTPPVQPEAGDDIQAIAVLLTGPSPAYVVQAVAGCPEDVCTEAAVETAPRLADAKCWEAVASTAADGQRWGQSSLFCFDPGSNALVARQTLSSNRIETFVASIIQDHVDNHELQPK